LTIRSTNIAARGRATFHLSQTHTFQELQKASANSQNEVWLQLTDVS